MKLGTLRTPKGPRVIVATTEGYLDAAQALGDKGWAASSLRSLIASWDDVGDRLKQAVQNAEAGRPAGTIYPLDEGQLAPPVGDPRMILCIGLNYQAHADETGLKVKDHPEIFMRSAKTLVGPRDEVWLPSVSDQLDLEVELCAVVGRGGRHLAEDEALDALFGWTVFNDLSVRDFQNHASQWIPGKNFDRSAPCGPFVVTRDEVKDPGHLDVSSAIDDFVMQQSNTEHFIFDIPRLLAEVSSFTTLEPGDLIATGTPPGVGVGRNPKRWLKAGETVICTVESVGSLRNKVVPEPGPGRGGS